MPPVQARSEPHLRPRRPLRSSGAQTRRTRTATSGSTATGVTSSLSRPAGAAARASRATPRRSLRFTLVRGTRPTRVVSRRRARDVRRRRGVRVRRRLPDEDGDPAAFGLHRLALPRARRGRSQARSRRRRSPLTPRRGRGGRLRRVLVRRPAPGLRDRARRVRARAQGGVPRGRPHRPVRGGSPGRPPRARRGVDRNRPGKSRPTKPRVFVRSRFAIRDPVASVREPRSEDDGRVVSAHAPRPRTMVAAPQDVRPVTPEETEIAAGRDASVEKKRRGRVDASPDTARGVRRGKVPRGVLPKAETEARAERRPGPRRQRAETETARGKGVTRRTETRANATRTFFGFVMTGEDIFSAWDSTSTGPRSSFVPPTRARIAAPRPVASVALSR